MPVTTEHPDYMRHIRQWRRCEDVIEGQDAVKAKATTYLPKLAGQKDEEYASYIDRAQFFNATGRTVDGMTGTVLAQSPIVVMPPALDEMAKDITLAGATHDEFVNELLEEVIGVGRVGILVDYPSVDASSLTQAQAREMNLRPYVRSYDAVNIINWATDTHNGAERLTLVVLKEMRGDWADEFDYQLEEQYRVLDLSDGRYRQRVFRAQPDGSFEVTEFFPTMNGKPITTIPFRFVNVTYSGAFVDVPPLLDLVDTNLAHYRNSADYEHGLHFTGLPQAYVAGVTLEPGATLQVGSPNAWVFTDPQAKAGYLEFQGQGLSALKAALDDKEQRMAVLGARLLLDDKKAAEAVEAIQIRFAGEHSVLSSIARSVSLAMEWALNWMAQWSGVTGNIVYKLSTDYSLSRMSPQMVTALVAAWQTRSITRESLFQALQKGDIIAASENFTDYLAKLELEGPGINTVDSANDLGLISSVRRRLNI